MSHSIRPCSHPSRNATCCYCTRRGMGVQLPVSLTAYSVVGAAAYMGGATRMTLTTTVMVMETTGALQLIVPIMLTVFVAKARLLPVIGFSWGLGFSWVSSQCPSWLTVFVSPRRGTPVMQRLCCYAAPVC